MSSAGALGSAGTQAEVWGARANDWAEVQEGMALPLYLDVLSRLEIRQGDRLLDVGCGSGTFANLAQARGLVVDGLDATPEMLEIARKRCPEATFQQGDMESLPYEPNQFHIVTGFNSFQFASSPINALGEVARVGTPGAQVVIATWGPADKCDAAAYLKAVSSLLPPMPVGTPGPFAMSQPGALEALAREARLHPVESHDVECIWDYKDEPTLLRAMLSSGRSVSAINRVGEARTIQGILTALVPYRTPEGGYRLRNVFRYLIAEL